MGFFFFLWSRPVANNSMDFEFETILQTLDEYEDNTLQS